MRLNDAQVADRAVPSGVALPLDFEIPWTCGTLEAIAFRNGREIGRRRLKTASPAAQVRWSQAVRSSAPRGSLSFVQIEIIDA